MSLNGVVVWAGRLVLFYGWRASARARAALKISSSDTHLLQTDDHVVGTGMPRGRKRSSPGLNLLVTYGVRWHSGAAATAPHKDVLCATRGTYF